MVKEDNRKIGKSIGLLIRTSAHLHICTFFFIFFQCASAHTLTPVDSVGVKNVNGKKFIIYKTEQGEGWYGIARKFGLPVKEVEAANEEVINKPLVLGQTVLIPMSRTVATKSETKAADMPKKENKDEWKSAAAKGNKIEEHGMASFIEDEDINPFKYYALHRTAPKGTIIKVTNIMNKKEIYVKVVGTLANTGDNNDLIIKISKASAMKLNVFDSHFQVVLNYFGE